MGVRQVPDAGAAQLAVPGAVDRKAAALLRAAAPVINHLGDQVMKVFRVA